MTLNAAPLPARTPPAEGIPDWWPYAAEFPDWHAWRGVAGLFYARRPRSSPPKVVRAKTPAGLRDQIQLTQGTWPVPVGEPHADALAELRWRRDEQARFGGPLPAGL